MREAPTGVGDILRDRKVVVDVVAPTVLFAGLAGTAGLPVASAVALGWCAVVVAVRARRRDGLLHAMSGLGGVAVGIGIAMATGQAEAFFLPGIIGNLAFGTACILSVLARRPAVAWSSAALYRWPLEWYWHPRVRPAYSEITWLWAAYYLAKGGWQLQLVRDGSLAALATVRVVLGWPGLIALLLITYAYVQWRLDRLGAPDVEAFRDRAPDQGAPPAT